MLSSEYTVKVLDVLVDTGVIKPPIENENETSLPIAVVKAFVISMELFVEVVTTAHFNPLFMLRIVVQLLLTAVAEVIDTSVGKNTCI